MIHIVTQSLLHLPPLPVVTSRMMVRRNIREDLTESSELGLLPAGVDHPDLQSPPVEHVDWSLLIWRFLDSPEKDSIPRLKVLADSVAFNKNLSQLVVPIHVVHVYHARTTGLAGCGHNNSAVVVLAVIRLERECAGR